MSFLKQKIPPSHLCSLLLLFFVLSDSFFGVWTEGQTSKGILSHLLNLLLVGGLLDFVIKRAFLSVITSDEQQCEHTACGINGFRKVHLL